MPPHPPAPYTAPTRILGSDDRPIPSFPIGGIAGLSDTVPGHQQRHCVIQLHSISIALGGHPILDNLSWSVRPRRRIGLIGANGAGKTTLLRLLAGELEPDEGTIARAGSIGYLAQDVQEHDTGRTVIDEALGAFEELNALEAREAALTKKLERHALPPEGLLKELERVHTELAVREAHRKRSRAEAVLLGLGFKTADLNRTLETLSGGYRMRITLAQILLQKPKVLLLDEPTNHLDIESIDWLEKYLQNYPGTVVLVSHDRYFLNRMVRSIAHLRQGRITEYAGNYDFFLSERASRRVLEQAAYENQQREIAQTRRFIERFRYKNTKARQVQSRIKHLQRMERLLPPESEEAQITIRFPVPRPSGRVVVELSTFSKRYPAPGGASVGVFRQAGPLCIERGQKVALIGRNGAGKSTLARIIAGTEPFDGTRRKGYHVYAGFFAQHQAESLAIRHTVLESLQEASGSMLEGQLRTLLGAFLFRGDDVFKRVAVLSGGEKSRLALARTLVTGTNFLILDEPTNHLDIQSIQVLIEALRQYQGTFVVVSHDRHFLDQVANTVWHIDGGRVRVYGGTYSEFRWHMAHGAGAQVRTRKAVPVAKTAAKKRTRLGGPKSRAQKRREAEARMRASGAKHAAPDHGNAQGAIEEQVEAAEQAIAKLEQQREQVEALLGSQDLYREPARVTKASTEYARVQAELKAYYARWESLMKQK